MKILHNGLKMRYISQVLSQSMINIQTLNSQKHITFVNNCMTTKTNQLLGLLDHNMKL